tara:strand:+ start:211 stop:618 length:408 start_codon:yes stop_codon:yes gene_type:complete
MSKLLDKPYLIDFPKIGEPSLGYISVAEKTNLPFTPKRIYWIYNTPEKINRGFHAHKNLSQVIIAITGKIKLKLVNIKGEILEFHLDGGNHGLFIPKLYWREIRFSKDAILLCLASEPYKEDDYIRSYDEFLKLL